MIQRDMFGNSAETGYFNRIFPSLTSPPIPVAEIPFKNMNEFIIALTYMWERIKAYRTEETISDELFFGHIQNYQLVTTEGYHYQKDIRSLHRLIKKAYDFCERDERSMKHASKKFKMCGNYCSASFYETKADVRNKQKFAIKHAFAHVFTGNK